MALISTACQSEDSAAVLAASQFQEARAGLGQDDYGVVYTYPGMPGVEASSWWKDLISGAVKTVEGIATAKTQTKGVLTQTAPGVFTYVQPEGSTATLPVATTGVSAQVSSGAGMVLVAGAALLVLFMMMRRK